MKVVKMGSSLAPFHCSEIGLGCMGMSWAYTKQGETQDDTEIKALFDKCVELGVSLLNTCEFYGPDNHNEKLIGRHIAGRTDKFQISLKVGGNLVNGMPSLDCSPGHIEAAVDKALELLGVPYIDLVIQARQDPKTPLKDVMLCFRKLLAQGKVKHVGLSEASPAQIREAQDIVPITCIEQEWSLWSRDIEDGIVPVCRELGIGILAYAPLGRGFLTGALTAESMKDLDPHDFRVHGQPRMQGDNLATNLALVEHVKKVAAAKGCTAGQVALAWLYRQAAAMGVQMVPIPGTKRLKYLEENVAALDVVLDDADMSMLNDTFSGDSVAGDRYAHAHLMFKK